MRKEKSELGDLNIRFDDVDSIGLGQESMIAQIDQSRN